MNDLRKAAEMALETLCVGANDAVPNDIDERFEQAIQALRQALAEPEQEPLGGEWVPCVKLPVIVHVRNQRDGENHISTREGITPVLPDDLIMRGVAGEEYPIGRELFERTYTFDIASSKREWVGLTDVNEMVEAELTHYWNGEYELTTGARNHLTDFAQAIEAKLKEKNL